MKQAVRRLVKANKSEGILIHQGTIDYRVGGRFSLVFSMLFSVFS